MANEVKKTSIPRARTAAEIRQGYTDAALQAPIEKRQKFIDEIWAGKTISEAYEAADLTFEQALGVMNLNVVTNQYSTLNRVSA